MRVVFDIESNGLLSNESIDYNASPYKLRDNFAIHVIVCYEVDNDKVVVFCNDKDAKELYPSYTHYQLNHFPEYSKKVSHFISHNGINYDHLVLKLAYGLDYNITSSGSFFDGRECIIEDTFIMSKTLNPDRERHSLSYFGKVLGDNKIDYRAALQDEGALEDGQSEFEQYHPLMIKYCVQDVMLTKKVYDLLVTEKGGWKWDSALSLEHCVAYIITMQEHHGFFFDRDVAKEAISELDRLMQEAEGRVLPYLPKKQATKTSQAATTPPKIQFKKDGSVSSALIKFAAKVGGEIVGNDTFIFKGKMMSLPLERKALVADMPMKLSDTTQIKEWLVSSCGWEPAQWSERDLSVDQFKKKLSREKYVERVNRYVEQSMTSPFLPFRCSTLNCTPDTLAFELLHRDTKKPVVVRTTPSFTAGLEKNICPTLDKVADSFPYAKDLIQWLTYRHRRNSILGGGAEYGEDADKGYLSYVREDGRIPTPADTCGCNTSRMKHKVVANVPRLTSLYGEKMRSLFRCDPSTYQIGYDAAGLEARIEGHYTFKYDGESYARELVADKPNDCHTIRAKQMNVSRDVAKSVKYAATYGAQPAKIAQQLDVSMKEAKRIYNSFWESAAPLSKLKDNLEKYWTANGKAFILGIDGRKIPTRSKHSLLNSLFQSAGLICMKRAMVIWHEDMVKEGLHVDFFSQNYMERDYAQQMIHYHDEAQVEVSRSLVRFKMFESEEDAKKWLDNNKDDGNIYSNIGHTSKGYYIAYSKVGQLAVESIRKAGEYYNLNIPLDADYSVGMGWHQTH